MKFATKFLLAVLIVPCSLFTLAGDSTASHAIDKAVADKNMRSEDNMNRDEYRHPAETLKFFGVKPDMDIIEIWPGGGWYAEILIPLVAEKGSYTAALMGDDMYNGYGKKANDKFKAAFMESGKYPAIKTTTLFPPGGGDLSDAGQVDMILTFRNVHNWMGNGFFGDAMKAFHQALKPGGVLAVVEHRADPDAELDPKAQNGYVNQDWFIKEAEKHGFKLVAQSGVNANAKDTKNYPKGVWSLPPSLAMKEDDKDKYMAIGESDRFTLKFVKQ